MAQRPECYLPTKARMLTLFVKIWKDVVERQRYRQSAIARSNCPSILPFMPCATWLKGASASSKMPLTSPPDMIKPPIATSASFTSAQSDYGCTNLSTVPRSAWLKAETTIATPEFTSSLYEVNSGGRYRHAFPQCVPRMVKSRLLIRRYPLSSSFNDSIHRHLVPPQSRYGTKARKQECAGYGR